MARCSTDEARTVVEPAETAKTLTLLKRLVARISPSEKVSHLGGDQYIIGGRAVQVKQEPSDSRESSKNHMSKYV